MPPNSPFACSLGNALSSWTAWAINHLIWICNSPKNSFFGSMNAVRRTGNISFEVWTVWDQGRFICLPSVMNFFGLITSKLALITSSLALTNRTVWRS